MPTISGKMKGVICLRQSSQPWCSFRSPYTLKKWKRYPWEHCGTVKKFKELNRVNRLFYRTDSKLGQWDALYSGNESELSGEVGFESMPQTY